MHVLFAREKLKLNKNSYNQKSNKGFLFQKTFFNKCIKKSICTSL